MLTAHFDSIRVINLESRADRRRDMLEELQRAGVRVDGSRVAFHRAACFSEPGGFPSAGARGCFMSHLEILRHAADEHRGVLILEDDSDFVPQVGDKVAQILHRAEWDMFYGGFLKRSSSGRTADPTEWIGGSHFVAFNRRGVDLAVPFLTAMLARPPGSREGGPMHVDGAYNWFRAAYPELTTIVADPPLAHQRSSRTDIHPLGPLDTIPGIRNLVSGARRLRRRIQRLAAPADRWRFPPADRRPYGS